MGIESVANFRSYGFRKNTDEASAHLTANAQTSSGKAEQATSKDRLSTAKKNVLGFAKALLKTAGDFALDRVVGAGVAVGAVSLEEAPLVKQKMKDIAEKAFRFMYVDGPKTMADHITSPFGKTSERGLAWQLAYRAFQVIAVAHPLVVPAFALTSWAEKKLELQSDLRPEFGKKTHAT